MRNQKNTKFHYKMYKSKKVWVTVGLMTAGVASTIGFAGPQVHADEAVNTNTGSQAASNADASQSLSSSSSTSVTSGVIFNRSEDSMMKSSSDTSLMSVSDTSIASSSTDTSNSTSQASSTVTSAISVVAIRSNADNILKAAQNVSTGGSTVTDPTSGAVASEPSSVKHAQKASASSLIVTNDSDTGQSQPVFDATNIVSTGTWNKAQVQVDKYGNALVSNGSIHGAAIDYENMNQSSGSITGDTELKTGINLSNGVLPSQIRTLAFNDVTYDNSDQDLGIYFNNMPDLQLLNLSGISNWGQVTNMNNMFSNDSNLKSVIYGDNFDTSNVTDMGYMFKNDTKLVSMTLPDQFNTTNVTDMSGMFANNINLTSLSLGNNFNTTNVANMYEMFMGDSSLTDLNLGGQFNTNNVTNMSQMFMDVPILTTYNLGNQFSTLDVADMTDMFNGISNNSTIQIGSQNTKFDNTTDLPTIAYLTTNNNTANLTDGNSHVGTWRFNWVDIPTSATSSEVDSGVSSAVVTSNSVTIASVVSNTSLVFDSSVMTSLATSTTPSSYIDVTYLSISAQMFVDSAKASFASAIAAQKVTDSQVIQTSLSSLASSLSSSYANNYRSNHSSNDWYGLQFKSVVFSVNKQKLILHKSQMPRFKVIASHYDKNGLVGYQVKYHNQIGMIKTSLGAINLAYYQNVDVKNSNAKYVEVLKPIFGHTDFSFSNNRAYQYTKGVRLRIKSIHVKNGLTRFKLANHQYVTGNKYFVKLVK